MGIKKILLNTIKGFAVFFVGMISMIVIMIPLPCGNYRLNFFNATGAPVRVEFYQRTDYRTEKEGKRWIKEIGHGQSKIFRIAFRGSARYAIDVTYPDGKVINEDLDYLIGYHSGARFVFIGRNHVESADWEYQLQPSSYIPVLSDMTDVFYLIEREASCLDNYFLRGYPY